MDTTVGLRIIAAIVVTFAVATTASFAPSSGAAAGRDGAPVPLRLVFDGIQDPGHGQANPRRSGAFTAGWPVCGAGVATDQRDVYPLGVLREHDCADGSGSFTALLEPVLGELGGTGAWRILGGTGAYARLRGKGTFVGELLGGNPSGMETISFRTTWTGLVGADRTPPRIRALRASLRRARRNGTYVLRVSFRTMDDVAANRVEYRVLPTSGSYVLPFAEGRARSRSVSVSLVVAPRRLDLPVVVEVRVADPLGNDRVVLRSVRLPA